MNDNEINIAIAEACGWTREWVNKERHIQQWVCRRPDGSVDYCDPDPDAGWEVHRLPPYTTDLNAMHEAEKVLTVEQKEDSYQTHLNDVVSDEKSGLTWGLLTYLSVHATARQRAEAFLRTIGKWKD